ncbi:MAG TPA: type I-C CRISPR-associated protein Cas8c/Csd1 [Kiritimatiellia bacterium]|nr:type I-C CRISPR-associated protein Cas8c/Csd1 [Kiritimatiellia bacterium]HQQ04554.1 type I-C CRISPR-associated protein Cas8c/Csd1 [Kiritimatiellia bacterium]
MILKALADYYDRLFHDDSADVPPYGFEDKGIPFVIIIGKDGRFLNIRDTRTGTGKQQSAREFRVPLGEKKTSGSKANLLWDNPQYVLGVPKSEKAKDVKKAKDDHKVFLARLHKDLDGMTDDGVSAVFRFYETGGIDGCRQHALLSDIMEHNSNITFALDDEVGLIAQRPNVVERIRAIYEEVNGRSCASAISGEIDEVAVLHAAIKGVWGAQTSGANIVSFNDEAYCSHGKTKKDQGLNAPIGKHNQFAYTTALNRLLASENQRMQVGDASTVFWAKNPCDFEQDFHSFLAPPKGEESVSYDKIRGLLSAVKTGIPPREADLPFYVLGLAPNASRIAIRFWYDGNVKEIKERVAQHFHDLELVRAPHDPEFLSLFQLLVSTATERKADNIPPNLGGDVARAVLTGIAYPRTLFANAIRRCKAEQSVGFARASIIKAFLVRNARISKSNQKEVSMALDKTYDNIGYVLGRLFAVLERIQYKAQGKQNKTIRDTYFGAAASSPLVTFRRLEQLSVHHLAKMRNSNKKTTWLEMLLDEVNGLLPKEGYPSILSLEDQGRFSVGYHHQRQDLFPTTETTEEGEEQ